MPLLLLLDEQPAPTILLTPSSLSFTSTSGPQLFVATTGNDANNGTTTGQSVATLSRANTLAASYSSTGVTVNLADGTYTAPATTGWTLSNGGANAGSRVIYKAVNKWGAKIAGPSNTAGDVLTISGQYIDLQDLEITGGRVTINVIANNVRILGNLIHDVCKTDPLSAGGAAIDVYNSDGIYSAMAGIDVSRNVVYDVGLSPGTNQTTQGIYLAVPCPDGICSNNITYGITDYGIHLFHNPRYWNIVNNIVYGCGRGLRSGPDALVSNNIVKNIGSGGSGGSLYAVSTNTDGGAAPTVRTNIGHNGTGTPSGFTITDPLFSAVPAAQSTAFSSTFFRLGSTSPAKNAGTNGDAPSIDFEGTTRPQGTTVDIGCYEIA